MKPKICLSISNLKDLASRDLDFKGYELRKDLDFNIIKILKLKSKFNGKDLSLHSRLSRIFSCNDKNISEFSEAELNILKSEIIVANILGAKEINFHMKEGELSSDEIKKFNEIIDFAEEKNVKMIYENHVCSEEVIFKILETFPKVNFCLDLGHLNIAMHNGKFKMNLDTFIDKIKSRVVHIHVHNNYGKTDEHNSIDKGDFPWKKLLDKLQNNLRKIIIECDNEKDISNSKEILENYLI